MSGEYCNNTVKLPVTTTEVSNVSQFLCWCIFFMKTTVNDPANHTKVDANTINISTKMQVKVLNSECEVIKVSPSFT